MSIPSFSRCASMPRSRSASATRRALSSCMRLIYPWLLSSCCGRAPYCLGGRSVDAGVFVVVSGPPASGKTTLSGAIAPALGLPLIAKDAIKQALMTVLPVTDVAASRVVGRASVAALLAVAAESGGAVLESVWHRYAVDDLRRLPGEVVEVV